MSVLYTANSPPSFSPSLLMLHTDSHSISAHKNLSRSFCFSSWHCGLSSNSSSGALGKFQPVFSPVHWESHLLKNEWDTTCGVPSTAPGTQWRSVTVSYYHPSTWWGSSGDLACHGRCCRTGASDWPKFKRSGSLPSLWWQTQQHVCSCCRNEARISLWNPQLRALAAVYSSVQRLCFPSPSPFSFALSLSSVSIVCLTWRMHLRRPSS